MRAGRPALFVREVSADTPRFGSGHPLSIPRVATVPALCEALGWLEAAQLRECLRAGVGRLSQFHGAEYIAALPAAGAAGCAAIGIRERFGIGTRGNRVLPGLSARAAATVGGAALYGAAHTAPSCCAWAKSYPVRRPRHASRRWCSGCPV